MTTNSWVGLAGFAFFGTEFTTDSDWSLGHVPTSTEDAVINSSGAIVDSATSSEDVNSIALGAGTDLDISDDFLDALNATGPNVNAGSIFVENADLLLGNTSNDATFDNTGSVQLDGTSASTAVKLLINGSVSLTGSGSIEMTIGDPVAGNAITGNFLNETGNPTLINETEDVSGTGSISAINFINDATVETNNSTSGSGGVLQIDGSAPIVVGSPLPSFVNNGTVRADNGGTLIFGIDGVPVTIVNNKTIELDSTGSATTLEIADSVTISGTGGEINDTIFLTGATDADAANDDRVVSDGNPATLTLVGETLKGAGRVGDSNLILDNQSGIIDADDPGDALNLTTGGTITNGAAASLQADGGELGLLSPVANAGTIIALDGGTVFALEPISGSGAVDIGQNGTLFTDTAISGDVTFTGSGAERTSRTKRPTAASAALSSAA